MTPQDARDLVATALRKVVPDADLEALDDTADLREAFELDSLDFLSFAETLGAGRGERIEEDDYPQLASLASCMRFLSPAGR
jgi:acyl carrier protein